MALVSCSRSFAALSSLCLDFVLRHRPRRRRPARVTIVPSFVLSACTSHHNSGVVAKIVSNRCLFQQRRTPKVSRLGIARGSFQHSGKRRCTRNHRAGLGRGDSLVRRTLAGPVLRIECAEGCRDGWPDAYDALLYRRPKQCNPKIAAEKQSRATHRGGALGMGRAINLHLLDRRLCMVHEAVPTRSVTVFVHPRL
jgi:hypothetical protein